MGDVQIVMVFDEQVDLPDVTIEGQEPSGSSLEAIHPMTEIDSIPPEMTEYGSGSGEHISRLWTGLYPTTLDAEAGSSRGHTLTSGAGSSSTTRVEATRSILSDDDDDASLDLEEQPPKQTTKDVKGKAPCRD
jgi:hypothetical protein